MFFSVQKDRLIDLWEFFPLTDTKGSQVFFRWQYFVVFLRSMGTVSKEGIVTIKFTLLNGIYRDTALKTIVKMKFFKWRENSAATEKSSSSYFPEIEEERTIFRLGSVHSSMVPCGDAITIFNLFAFCSKEAWTDKS